MKQNFTSEARKAIEAAGRTARYCRQNYIGTEHLLAGLLVAVQGTAAYVLQDAGVTKEKLMQLIDSLITPQGSVAVMDDAEYSPRAESALREAVRLADQLHSDEPGTEHILLALLTDSECVAAKLLHTMGIDLRKLYADTIAAMGEEGTIDEKTFAKAMAPKQGENGGSSLEKYGRDLTSQAEQGMLDPVIGRESEIGRVMQILSRRTKNNPCLIGEPGVGKTAIVEGLAQRIAWGIVPEQMRDKRLIMLDMSGMVAGTKYRGEFEERIKNVVKEVSESSNIILFVDELHTMIGAGGAEGALDASNILKPSLSRGEIQMIGATTIDEYRKYIEKDAALERRFQPVQVEEPTKAEALEILKGLRPYYESHHGVAITDEALAASVNLSERYVNDRSLPDKAIDLIDEAASKVRLGNFKGTDRLVELRQKIMELGELKERAIVDGDLVSARAYRDEEKAVKEKSDELMKKMGEGGRKGPLTVDENAVAEVVSGWTKIPVARLAEAESRRLARLERQLHKRVIGQDEAIRAVAGAVKRGRVGIKNPNRPTGSFLFLGPTGVGKTELSKAVAEAVFGSEQNLIRVDMSEYMEKYSVSKMIGSPPGYVGYDEGGQLSELLQVLDEGHITDSHGRKVDFKNTCIIMTSNAGAQSIVEPKRLGFGAGDDEKADYERMKSGVMSEVRRIFKPEFLNRIDEIIVFHMLNKKEVEQIVGLMTKELTDRAKSEMNIDLKITSSVKKQIAEAGFSPKYGARPLRRKIQEKIENPLSDMILNGEVREGGEVTVRVVKGEITFASSEE